MIECFIDFFLAMPLPGQILILLTPVYVWGISGRFFAAEKILRRERKRRRQELLSLREHSTPRAGGEK